MNTGKFIKVKGTKNYFVCEMGFVFKTMNRKEFIIPGVIDWGSYTVIVKIDNREINLAYLIASHLLPQIDLDSKFDYTINKDGYIPANSFKTETVLNNLTELDYKAMRLLGCFEKASNANLRNCIKVSAAEIYSVLQRFNFKCIYCGDIIQDSTWHLDHFYALARGGTNNAKNLVSSCSVCNIMKGALDGNAFHRRCKVISENFLLKEQ
jgi:hypothetical protein